MVKYFVITGGLNEKIKNLANMNYLWLLLGSYFIVVLFNLLRFSTEALFLKLGEVGIVGTIIGVVISYPFLWFIGEYKKLIDIGVLNTFLTALILFCSNSLKVQPYSYLWD